MNAGMDKPGMAVDLPPPYPGEPEAGHASYASAPPPPPAVGPGYPGYPAVQPVQVQVYGLPDPEGGVIVHQQPQLVTVQHQVTLGPFPVHVQCEECHALVLTSVEFVNGCMTWCACLLCFLFVGWIGCCLIPFCVDALRDVQHNCPRCRHLIGVYKRM